MKQYDEIEELFRSGLDNLEVEPAPGTWQAIQSRIPATSSATTASSGTGFGIGKILVTAGILTVSSVAVIFYVNNEVPNEVKTITENTTPPETLVNENIKAAPAEENTIEPGIPDPEPDNNKTAVTPSNKSKANPSVANGFMTKQTEKENLLRNNYNKTGNQNTARTEVENNSVKAVINSTEKEVESTEAVKALSAKIIADKTSGTAPLKVNFRNSTEGGSHEWTISDGSLFFEEKAEHTFNVPGSYEVMLVVRDRNGNSFSDRLTIEVKEPSVINFVNQNIFTPNGDGVNDVFRFECKNIEKFQVHIVNSSGDIVFQSNDPEFSWDGRDATGNLCQKGVYYYTVAALGTDGKQHQYLRKPLVLQ